MRVRQGDARDVLSDQAGRRPARRAAYRGATSPGFSLIELVVVLALIMIAAVLGFPTLRAVLHRSKTAGCAQQISVAMQQARFEAIKKGTPVTLAISGGALVSTSGGATLSRVNPPSWVSFEASRGFGGTNTVSFQSDGSVDATGAFRIVDGWGNHLEIAVEPQATARIEVRMKDASGVYSTEGTGGKAWSFQ